MTDKKKDKEKGKDAENIKVLIRCRPLNQKEKDTGYKSSVDLSIGDGSVTVHHVCGDPDRWTFDAVINNTFKQKDIFDQFITPMIESVLAGFNSTIFAYGQSGSGKTFTMTGVPDSKELAGAIPRSFDFIFSHIKSNSGPGVVWNIYCSYLELYNGHAHDLLAPASRAKEMPSLKIKENKDKTFFVQDLSQPQVKFQQDLTRWMEEGTERRRVASTDLNADSSRSHSIFTVYIQKEETNEDGDVRSVTSKLNLVDLAGSERQSKTGASGDALKEGCNINLSLSALGTVIDTIVKGHGHVPFRSSPLTMLLKDSLGGGSKTAMFANINPSEHNVSETVSTLRFADRAKQIKNKPLVQLDAKDQKIADLTSKVEELKDKLKKFQGSNIASLEAEVESLRESVGTLSVQKESFEEELSRTREDLDQATQQIAAEKAKALELSQEQAGEIDTLRAENLVLNQQAAREAEVSAGLCEAMVSHLKELLRREIILLSEEQLGRLDSMRPDDLKDELRAATSQVSSSVDKPGEAAGISAEVEEERARYEVLIEQMHADHKVERDRLSTLNAQAQESLKHAMARMDKMKARLDVEKEKRRATAQAKDTEARTYQTRIQELETVVAEHRGKVETLETALEAKTMSERALHESLGQALEKQAEAEKGTAPSESLREPNAAAEQCSVLEREVKRLTKMLNTCEEQLLQDRASFAAAAPGDGGETEVLKRLLKTSTEEVAQLREDLAEAAGNRAAVDGHKSRPGAKSPDPGQAANEREDRFEKRLVALQQQVVSLHKDLERSETDLNAVLASKADGSGGGSATKQAMARANDRIKQLTARNAALMGEKAKLELALSEAQTAAGGKEPSGHKGKRNEPSPAGGKAKVLETELLREIGAREDGEKEWAAHKSEWAAALAVKQQTIDILEDSLEQANATATEALASLAALAGGDPDPVDAANEPNEAASDKKRQIIALTQHLAQSQARVVEMQKELHAQEKDLSTGNVGSVARGAKLDRQISGYQTRIAELEEELTASEERYRKSVQLMSSVSANDGDGVAVLKEALSDANDALHVRNDALKKGSEREGNLENELRDAKDRLIELETAISDREDALADAQKERTVLARIVSSGAASGGADGGGVQEALRHEIERNAALQSEVKKLAEADRDRSAQHRRETLVDSQESEISGLRSRLTVALSALAQSESRRQSMTADCVDSEATRVFPHANVDVLASELAMAAEKCTMLSERNADLSEELALTREHELTLQERLDELSKQQDESVAALTQAAADGVSPRSAAVAAELGRVHARAGLLEKDLKHLRRTEKANKARIDGLKQDLARARSRIASLEAADWEDDGNNGAHTQDRAPQQTTGGDAGEEASALRRSLRKADGEVQKLRKRAKLAAAGHAAVAKENERLQEELYFAREELAQAEDRWTDAQDKKGTEQASARGKGAQVDAEELAEMKAALLDANRRVKKMQVGKRRVVSQLEEELRIFKTAVDHAEGADPDDVAKLLADNQEAESNSAQLIIDLKDALSNAATNSRKVKARYEKQVARLQADLDQSQGDQEELQSTVDLLLKRLSEKGNKASADAATVEQTVADAHRRAKKAREREQRAKEEVRRLNEAAASQEAPKKQPEGDGKAGAKEREDLKQKIRDLERQVHEGGREKVTKVENEKLLLKSALTEKTKRAEELESALEDALLDLDSARKELERELVQAAELQKQTLDMSNQLAALKKDLLTERQAHAAANEHLAAASRKYKMSEAEAKRKNAGTSDLMKQVEDKRKQAEDALDMVRNLQNVITSLHEREQSQAAKLQDVRAKLEDKDARVQEQLEDVEKSMASLLSRRLAEAREGHKKELKRKAADAEKLLKKIAKGEIALQKVKERYDTKVVQYEDLVRNFEEFKIRAWEREQAATGDPIESASRNIQSIIQGAKVAKGVVSSFGGNGGKSQRKSSKQPSGKPSSLLLPEGTEGTGETRKPVHLKPVSAQASASSPDGFDAISSDQDALLARKRKSRPITGGVVTPGSVPTHQFPGFDPRKHPHSAEISHTGHHHHHPFGGGKPSSSPRDDILSPGHPKGTLPSPLGQPRFSSMPLGALGIGGTDGTRPTVGVPSPPSVKPAMGLEPSPLQRKPHKDKEEPPNESMAAVLGLKPSPPH
eukprot:gene14296-21926_t